MNALITGISGFVGPYLKKELETHGYNVFGIDRTGASEGTHNFHGDITSLDFVREVVKKVKPDEIYHLAGFSSVKKSFEQPELAMAVNVDGTKNILLSVREFCPKAKVLIVSSADVYGNAKKIPITEEEELKETSPYSKSRILQEKLVSEFSDLHVVISRSFNHTGPGQLETFVLSDFCKQVVEIERGVREPLITTGDLSVIRDFSDVRDVVNAYYNLLQKGKSGEFYNVGSGIGYSLNDLLEKIIKLSGVNITVKQDPEKMRAIEIMALISDTSKVFKDTGWRPVYSIDKIIVDLLDYWRSKI